MDGYTKAAIREALSKRSPRQVHFDNFMDRLINGPLVYVFCVGFYGLLGWMAWAFIFSNSH
jgi:hypothetical protein